MASAFFVITGLHEHMQDIESDHREDVDVEEKDERDASLRRKSTARKEGKGERRE